ncbi:MAG: hypothetical protein ACM31O_03435 [Bacteroidota bacterium]
MALNAAGDFERWVRDRGWSWEKTNGGHVRIAHPAVAKPLFVPSTPSEYRSGANCRALVLRAEREAGLPPQEGDPRRRVRSSRIEPFAERREGQWRILTVVCSCGAQGLRRTKHNAPASISFFKPLIQRGWRIGEKRAFDRCPVCAKHPITISPTRNGQAQNGQAQNGANGHNSHAIETAAAPKPAPAKPISKETREAQSIRQARDLHSQERAQRRRLLRAIDRVYVDDKTGYVAGESDATVAERMKVDASQIARLREEFFGPLVEGGALVDIKRELHALKKKLERFQRETLEGAAALESTVVQIAAKLALLGPESVDN